jgi:ornithine cyclodeaminase/alanine dehydrogenase
MPHKTLILTHADVRALCDMPLAMTAVEAGFRAYAESSAFGSRAEPRASTGRARMPAKVYLDLPEYDGDFRAMPSLLGDYAGVKWVNAHPQNGVRFGLPTVLGTYVLSDPKTALPLAVMDATLLTALRTGAAAGVATKYLARLPLSRVGFIGAGVQARMFRDALATLSAADPRAATGGFELLAADKNPAAAESFVRESIALGFQAHAVAVPEACAAPVICIATPSSTPVIARDFIRDGTHINAMGADGPGKQELDPRILRDARIIVDEPEQSLHGGELNVPVAQGLLSERDIAATLGEVICGTKPGRTSVADITVFDSTGLAIQDVALASALYERARARGVGIAVELVPAG